MTKRLINEVGPAALSQPFTVNKNMACKALRLKLYKHKDPAGTYTVKLKKGAEELASKSLTSAEINTLAGFNPDEYQLGYFTFEFNQVVRLDEGVEYTASIESDTAFSEASYIGWEKPKYDNIMITPNPSDDLEYGYGLQVWGY